MFGKILVANRGAVAARIIRAAREMGCKTVAVYSEADKDLPYLRAADEACLLGAAPPKDSYLNIPRLIEVLTRTGADAVHPGYGFLSEDAEFARAVTAAGAVFIGPTADWIDQMGHKTRARAYMAGKGLAMRAGSPVLPDAADEIRAAARAIGYPVIVKAAGGGGGIGMQIARDEAGLAAAVEKARSLSARSFASSDVYLEPYLEEPRHIEFQTLADNHGNAMHLFERDCSVQRRHQKVIEEAPAPGLNRQAADRYAAQVAAILGGAGYRNLGTVETLSEAGGDFNFLEMNTRLQVEHAVTEAVTGVDIVKAQIRLAAGARLADVVPRPPAITGAAIEARIYAEDPVRFFPSPGPLTRFVLPDGPGIRVETGYAEGCSVTPFYDPMVAKIIAHGATRDIAIDRLDAALERTEITGIKTNIPFVLNVLRSEEFRRGTYSTNLAAQLGRRVPA